jgi:hypothetical protein
LVTLKAPLAFAVSVREAPVRVSVTVTSAPGTGVPFSSATVPSIPVVICWA